MTSISHSNFGSLSGIIRRRATKTKIQMAPKSAQKISKTAAKSLSAKSPKGADKAKQPDEDETEKLASEVPLMLTSLALVIVWSIP